jgi:hypothetical protein
MQSEQYLFRNGTLAIPLSTYTSNDANFPSHQSHDMIARPFMTSEIDSTLAATILDCKPAVVATGEHADRREYIDVVNVLYRHK